MLGIGQRLRQIRESKGMSQGDIEKKTGLIRCYTSRVENGFTVPSLTTLAKYANAFGIPLYQLFYDGEKPPEVPFGVGESLDSTVILTNREQVLVRRFRKLSPRHQAIMWYTISTASRVRR